MINYKILTENCYECRSCIQHCPRKAIQIIRPDLWSAYSIVDQKKCIQCGICKKVCPSCEPVARKNPIKTYAAISLNKQAIFSSSGGMFLELAMEIIKLGGYVVGAAYDDDWSVYQKVVSETSDLEKLQGSKYVKSNVADSYRYTYDLLKAGKWVLYSGTPCQIAGLKKYILDENIQNRLLTVDIICHGTPPVSVFKDYLTYISEKKHFKILKFSFRNKKYGHRHIGSYIASKNKKIKSYLLYSSESSYFSLFLSGTIYNEICYKCEFASTARVSDITLGDFWGAEMEIPDFFKENFLSKEESTSAVIINTEKGNDFFEKVKNNLIYKQIDYEKIIKHNPQLKQPMFCEKNIRDILLKQYKLQGYEAIEKYYQYHSDYKKYLLRLLNYIPNEIKYVIKRFLKKR